ncbi:integrase [Siculibacillus lacustris]|uniref:Integrase n=1 Tax=Siculibacillus lacustris TaxID=1549641 RepID=A0A4Q9VTA8_9HYPH|nr:site-specific integrase [Siculibacillus lacustris]TBW38799.1 integrase [Siculibacillus lacustris]
MATHPDYPFISSFRDRHGRERWRFRRAGKTISMVGAPGEAAFEVAYRAAIEGRKIEKAEVRRLPAAAPPRSLRAAWRILTTGTIEWKSLGAVSKANQTAIAERFFTTPIYEGAKEVYGDMGIDELERRHVKAILARWAATPHAAAHILRLIRKLVTIALDEEWISVDPTHRLRYRPEYEGWRAWTAEERIAYEARWPIGSTPRLVYALALYSGQRRGDLVALRWADINRDEITLVQHKTGKALCLTIHPDLATVLQAAPRSGETILVTQYGQPFSDKALGMRMQDWTKAAGIGAGATLHGLRKTLGKLLAESGATTRELMDVLGHDDIAHAELYSREAEQKLMARNGMAKLGRAKRPQLVKGQK